MFFALNSAYAAYDPNMDTSEVISHRSILQYLPDELLCCIAFHIAFDSSSESDPNSLLNISSLLRLSECCRSLKTVTSSDELLWRKLYAQLSAGKTAGVLPVSRDSPFYLVDFGGQRELLRRTKSEELLEIIRERLLRDLVPEGWLDAVDFLLLGRRTFAKHELSGIRDTAAFCGEGAAESRILNEATSPSPRDPNRCLLEKAVLSTHPSWLTASPTCPPTFDNVYKLSYFTLLADLKRTFITSYELTHLDFAVSFRNVNWLGWQEERRPLHARHLPNGQLLIDTHVLQWRFLGDPETATLDPGLFARIHGAGSHHSQRKRTVQSGRYSPKKVSRTKDGGWVLSNAQVTYESAPSSYFANDTPLNEAEAENDGVEQDMEIGHTAGPMMGLGFAKEVTKVLAMHVVVVFGFTVIAAYLV